MKKKILSLLLIIFFIASVLVIAATADAGDFAGDNDYGWGDDGGGGCGGGNDDYSYDNDRSGGCSGGSDRSSRTSSSNSSKSTEKKSSSPVASSGIIVIYIIFFVMIAAFNAWMLYLVIGDRVKHKIIIIVIMVLLSVLCLNALIRYFWNNSAGAFKYSENETSCSISKFNGSELGEAVVPDTHNNKPVTQITDSAFKDCSSLEKITLGRNVGVIGPFAFSGCKKLKSITIPSGLTVIKENAFSDCDKLETVYYEGTKEQWEKIKTGSYNEPLLNADVVCIYKITDYDPDDSIGKRDVKRFVIMMIVTGIYAAGVSALIIFKAVPEIKDDIKSDAEYVNVGDRSTPLSELKYMYKYKEIDPGFDENGLKSKIADVYKMMQNNWAKKDFSPMRPYFTDTLYAQFERQLQQKIDQGVTPHIEDISVQDVELRGFKQSGGLDHVIVKLMTRITVYTTNDATGEIVSGSRSNVKYMAYEWDLVRTSGMKTVEGENEGLGCSVCPSCGAPVKINASAKCEYCGSILRASEHDWVINSITALSQRTLKQMKDV